METAFDMFYETEVPEDELIVSRADFSGKITYVNETFADISGYEPNELIGQPHNVIRHPDMPKSVFAGLWDTIKNGDVWHGYVKNCRKDGGYYWVFAYITADYDQRGKIVGYSSFRRKPSRAAIDAIEPVYKLLIDAEKKGGMEASGKLLTSFLEENKTTYNDLIINLQKIVNEINLMTIFLFRFFYFHFYQPQFH